MIDWSKQTILLTGGTGSFGQCFTKILLSKYPPKSLRIYSRDEYKQYVMQKTFDHPALRYLIGDVRDEERLRRAMNGVTLVIHAAAMKQITATEYNPTEAIKTNILGTMNVLNASIDAGVKQIIGLITDKAVAPTNLYGATKLCAEKLLIQGNSYVGRKKTKISCVRYGNVAGSRGSVIPLFLQQREKRHLTITHPAMTRFWITLEQSAAFVMHIAGIMEGGEVFIPKMPSFRIADLADVMGPQVKKKNVGIRPGEKLHEDLITLHEARSVREQKKYFVLQPEFDFWADRGKKYKGKTVSKDFFYNSGINSYFLSKQALAKELKKLHHA